MLATIRSLKNVGISISLDDFGTGYASLAQVNTLPLDRIKIDKSFISTIVKSEQTAAIVNTIASLGHTLSVPITAEGVESEQVRSELKQDRLFGGAGLAVRPRRVRRYRAHLPRDEGRRRWRRPNETGGGRADAALADPPLVKPSERPAGAASTAHGKHRLAVDIARRRIAADQIIPVRLVECAADMRRRRPHHLRVVSDILPIAAAN